MLKAVVYSSSEWREFAETAHATCFGEIRPASMNRIDFAMLAVKDETPAGYITVREFDEESVYWNYGGVFPGVKNTTTAFLVYELGIQKCLEMGYKRITTLIENSNIVMLKMAMKIGFRIIGIRNFDSKIFCELLLNLKE